MNTTRASLLAAAAAFACGVIAACSSSDHPPGAAEGDGGYVPPEGGLIAPTADGGGTGDSAPPGDGGGVVLEGGGRDAATVDAAEACPADAGAASLIGSAVQELSHGAQTEPTPNGGAILPGTYVLTSVEIYVPADAGPGVDASDIVPQDSLTNYFEERTLILRADQTYTLISAAGTGTVGSASIYGGVYSTQGTDLILDSTCPVASHETHGYLSVGARLVVHRTPHVETYLRQ